MATAQDLNDLLLLLYRAARETRLEEFQEQAIGLLRPSLGFTSAQWGSAPKSPQGISKRTVFLYNDVTEAPYLYEEVKDQDTPVKYAWDEGSGVISYNVRTMFRDKAHAGIRNYARCVEHENVLLAFDVERVETSGTLISLGKWISFYRADPDQRFSNRDRKLAQLLSPHLWEALAINRVTNLNVVTHSALKSFFALGIVDRDGYVYYAEPEFSALLRAEFDQGGRCRLPEPCVVALLRNERFVGRSIVIEVTRPADILFLKARPVQSFDRLSRREVEIAKAVARGSSHKEIAKALAISPATARNHIQAIHEKLNVRNAVGLTEQISALS